MLRVVAKLWAYGVKAYPDRDFGIPTTMQETQTYDLHPLNHPAHSPLAGIDSLARYMQADIASSPATIVHFCGAHDVLHPGNVRLHERLLALGPFLGLRFSCRDYIFAKERIQVAPRNLGVHSIHIGP